jgi:glycosyltransferase involved in cell wall biosynthesis
MSSREVKFVVTIHDMTPKYFPGNKVGKSFFRRKIFDLVMGFALNKSEKVIAVSEFTKNEILKFYPNIKSEKIEVIYEGLRGEFFSDIKISQKCASSETLASLSSGSAHSSSENLFSDASQLYQKTPSKFSCGCSSEAHSCEILNDNNIDCIPNSKFIFYTGVWRNHKNLVGLIRAFKILKDKYKTTHKLVLGGSEDASYSEVRRAWEELSLEKDIILTGFLDLKDQILLYRNCDLYVSPSFSEGFGFTPIEAMSQGAAVALSDIPAHREISGDLPIFFDPNNIEDVAEKIYLALSDDDFRKKIEELGPGYAQKYQWQNCAQKTLNIYKYCAQ